MKTLTTILGMSLIAGGAAAAGPNDIVFRYQGTGVIGVAAPVVPVVPEVPEFFQVTFLKVSQIGSGMPISEGVYRTSYSVKNDSGTDMLGGLRLKYGVSNRTTGDVWPETFHGTCESDSIPTGGETTCSVTIPITEELKAWIAPKGYTTDSFLWGGHLYQNHPDTLEKVVGGSVIAGGLILINSR
ncbi:hypothetical protein LH464_22900 [Neorhizobium sp. T786]|uniref:hypothetical protein n=1 Tax=Pseudorhizobium xiangyangii TaxID=2883104 RepID=UPI001CFF7565|nr:hypothetical protein [Neorhizobium xiangyangii]MCB5205314.1 hypothetical protein [Neorhizobium xiangyangii]